MSRIFLVTFAMFISFNASALELACEAWHQPTGSALKRTSMTIGEKNHLNWKQSVEVEGYKYDVNWDINLDAIYVTISKEGKNVLFTTARVPTFVHNDSFTDIRLPDGLRLAVSCSFK